MLAETVEHQGGRPEKPSHDGTVFTPKLRELGITRNDSSRWKSIASIPEEISEHHVEETKPAKQLWLTKEQRVWYGKKGQHPYFHQRGDRSGVRS